MDLGDPRELQTLRERGVGPPARSTAGPIVNGVLLPGQAHAVSNPADRRDQVGTARDATPDEIKRPSTPAPRRRPTGIAAAAMRARLSWKSLRICSRRTARSFIELLVREAGKTMSDAIAEVREAVDFCRYYALRARKQFAAPQRLEGPTGELNELIAAGPRRLRLHQSVEFSAGDFRRPGHRRAGRGQRRGGEAGRTHAA